MHDNLRLCLNDGPAKYPDNPFFSILAGELSTVINPKALYDQLMTIFKGGWNRGDVVDMPDALQFMDCRLMAMGVSAVRRYPKSEDDNTYYGLSFVDVVSATNVPQSAVVLGGNGIGKSSLFVALEAMATGHSSIAAEHGYKGEKEIEYYYHSAGDELPKCVVRTLSDVILRDLLDDGTLNIPPSFFCASHDIAHLTRRDLSLGYVFQQIGRSDFYNFQTTLEHVIDFIDFTQEIKSIRSHASGGLNQEDRDAISEIKRLARSIFGIQKWSDAFEKDITEDFEKLCLQLHEYIYQVNAETVRSIISLIRPIMKDLVKDFLEEGVIDIVMSEEHSSVHNFGSMNLAVFVRLSDGVLIEPRRYFNTFRLKLFVVALKIALASYSKISCSVNFPMVFDDVFDASDFITKQRIEEFAESVVSSYNKLDNLKPYPLQIIFFTQDNLVAESSYRGFREAMGDDKVSFKVLFNYEECEESDVISLCDFNGKELFIKSVADEVV